MGTCCSSRDGASDRAIRKDLKKGLEEAKKEYKMLLLGTGQSGKTTVYKQMIRLDRGGLTAVSNDIEHYVRINAVEAITVLIKQSRIFVEEKYEECQIAEGLLDIADQLLEARVGDEIYTLTLEYGTIIAELWRDRGIKRTIAKKAHFTLQLNDNAAYFLNKAEAIFQEDYSPSEEDILKVRVTSTGMTEESFKLNSHIKLKMVDVGGQRSERRKWIRCFEGLDCVLFVVAISEFDQTLYEDGITSRFEESLSVWEEIINLTQFENTKFILFFNKYDIFVQKVLSLVISDYVENYDGMEHDVDSALQWFRQCYLEKAHGKEVIVYETIATDVRDMEKTLNEVKQIALNHSTISDDI